MHSKIFLQFCKIGNFILQIFNIRIVRKNNFSILQHTNYEIQDTITREIYPAKISVVIPLTKFCIAKQVLRNNAFFRLLILVYQYFAL